MAGGIDWGSIPDWLAAVGGFLAVGATTSLAWRERKRANRLEEAQVDTEYAQRQTLIDEAERIVGEIARLYANIAHASSSEFEYRGLGGTYKANINQHCDSLERLQTFSGTNARLYVALGHLAGECRFQDRMMMQADNGHKLTAWDLSRKLPTNARSLLEPLR